MNVNQANDLLLHINRLIGHAPAHRAGGWADHVDEADAVRRALELRDLRHGFIETDDRCKNLVAWAVQRAPALGIEVRPLAQPVTP